MKFIFYRKIAYRKQKTGNNSIKSTQMQIRHLFFKHKKDNAKSWKKDQSPIMFCNFFIEKNGGN